MTEPAPYIFTPEEIAEAKATTIVGFLLCLALVGGLQWRHNIERERERKESLSALSPRR